MINNNITRRVIFTVNTLCVVVINNNITRRVICTVNTLCGCDKQQYHQEGDLYCKHPVWL